MVEAFPFNLPSDKIDLSRYKKEVPTQVWPFSFALLLGWTTYAVNATQLSFNTTQRCKYDSERGVCEAQSISLDQFLDLVIFRDVILGFLNTDIHPTILLGASVFILALSFAYLITYDIEKLASSAPGAFRRLFAIFIVQVVVVLIFSHASVIAQDAKLQDVTALLRYLIVPLTLFIQVFSDLYVSSVYRKNRRRLKKLFPKYRFLAAISGGLFLIGMLLWWGSLQETIMGVNTNKSFFFGVDIFLVFLEALAIVVVRCQIAGMEEKGEL